MKIIVAAKCVLDANVKPQVKADGSGVDTQNAKMAINPFDEIAVEEAVRLKEAGVAAEILVVSIGTPKSEDVLRHALAMGADRAILVHSEVALEPLAVAKILQELVSQEAADLVILGKQAVDSESGQAGQMLAALLGWPQATFASVVEVKGTRIEVTRETDGGLVTVGMILPAVVTTDLRLNEPRYSSLPNIMRAKKKPLSRMALADLSVDCAPRLEVLNVSEPPARKPGEILSSVSELVDRLKTEARVL